jgi:hypothetical protein
MAEKQGPKAKPKSKPRFDDKAQSERFIEAARKLGIEETSDVFDTVVEKILKPNTHSTRRP